VRAAAEPLWLCSLVGWACWGLAGPVAVYGFLPGHDSAGGIGLAQSGIGGWGSGGCAGGHRGSHHAHWDSRFRRSCSRCIWLRTTWRKIWVGVFPGRTPRIASILLLFFAVGDILGFRESDPSWGVDTLLGSRRSIHFDVQGFSRTYWLAFQRSDFFLDLPFYFVKLCLDFVPCAGFHIFSSTWYIPDGGFPSVH
jgi:hypothetical protein